MIELIKILNLHRLKTFESNHSDLINRQLFILWAKYLTKLVRVCEIVAIYNIKIFLRTGLVKGQGGHTTSDLLTIIVNALKQ